MDVFARTALVLDFTYTALGRRAQQPTDVGQVGVEPHEIGVDASEGIHQGEDHEPIAHVSHTPHSASTLTRTVSPNGGRA